MSARILLSSASPTFASSSRSARKELRVDVKSAASALGFEVEDEDVDSVLDGEGLNEEDGKGAKVEPDWKGVNDADDLDDEGEVGRSGWIPSSSLVSFWSSSLKSAGLLEENLVGKSG